MNEIYSEFTSEQKDFSNLELKPIWTKEVNENSIKLVVEVLSKGGTTTTQYAEVLEMDQLDATSMEALFKGKGDINPRSSELTKSFLISYECSDCGQDFYENLPATTLKSSTELSQLDEFNKQKLDSVGLGFVLFQLSFQTLDLFFSFFS